MTSSASFRQFALENEMQDVTHDNTAMDAIYHYHRDEQKNILEAKPWATKYCALNPVSPTSPLLSLSYLFFLSVLFVIILTVVHITSKKSAYPQ